ncbi:MAG: hypothetical protein BWK76_18880 [Desulfobulbaceae bacterium A2]|nr:MAG: hypothetical protein BWK76_18880 [Desulfobulbaceae bacterium A2]
MLTMPGTKNPIINRVDRGLAYSFGALTLVLMLLVTGVSSYLFIKLQSREEDRLSGALAKIIGESISKVSFSGTYHARLFVEEIKAKTPEISGVSIATTEGRIIAHSDPANNGKMVTAEDLALLSECLASNTTVVHERKTALGTMEKVIVLPYGGGIDADIIGVIHLVINIEKTRQDQQSSIIGMLLVATLLSCGAVIVILLLSRHFGSAVKALALQLQAILDNSPALIYVKDRKGHYQFVNQAWLTLFHTEHSNVKGKNDLELFPETIARQFMTNDQLVMNSDTPLVLEEQAQVADTLRSYHSTKVALRDTNGTTYGLCGISTDITEKKKADEEFRQLANKQRIILDSSSVGICFLEDFKVQWANPAFEAIFGLPPESAQNRDAAEWFRDTAAYQVFRNHLSTAVTSGGGYSEDMPLKRQDGSPFWCNLAGQVIRPGSPQDGFILILHDITERKQAEEKIQILNEELEERVQLRTAELEQINAELQRLNQVFVGRELKMIELKERIRELVGGHEKARP